MQGEVSFFHDVKKYGFISPEEGEDDYFFHVSDLEGEEIAEGDEVEFQIGDSDRGPKAIDVQKL